MFSKKHRRKQVLKMKKVQTPQAVDYSIYVKFEFTKGKGIVLS